MVLIQLWGGGETLPISSVHMSPLASPMLDDLNGLMGQAHVDLATTFDFDLPPKGLDSMSTLPFKFPSLLSSVSISSGGEFRTDIYDAFSMASKVMTSTNGGAQSYALDSWYVKGNLDDCGGSRLQFKIPPYNHLKG